MDKEKEILRSWEANAGNWINVIEENSIESRKLITNKAIVDSVLSAKPSNVWDLGCGEGWLSAKLSANGIEVTGTDAISGLIEKAKLQSPGKFFVVTYDDIAAGHTPFSYKFDIIVINFALIGKESAEQLLHALPSYLNPAGKLFIQTLHPHSRKGINDYASGWKEGSWDGLNAPFVMPYQWYFRTLEDWLLLLSASGFSSVSVSEYFHPHTGNPLSVIFECAC